MNNSRQQQCVHSRQPLQLRVVALILLVIVLALSNMMTPLSTMYSTNVPSFMALLVDPATKITAVKRKETPRSEDPAAVVVVVAAAGSHQHLKIAVVSTFVHSTMWTKYNSSHKYLHDYSDHILNRECYCHLWKYDCIFNQTMELGLLYDNANKKGQPADNNNNTRTRTRANTATSTVTTAPAPSNTHFKNAY